jgi:uncharacterized Zn finger protein (UPF0148 family)
MTERKLGVPAAFHGTRQGKPPAEKKQMATIALICGVCGVTLFRHPTMRGQRVVCYSCQKVRKNEARRKQREAETAGKLLPEDERS